MAIRTAILCVLVVTGCNSVTQEQTSPTTVLPPPGMTVSCQPSPRFRFGGIEYEVGNFDDLVAEDAVGAEFASVLVLPREITNCVPFVELKDGEGSLPAGTPVYRIVGVDASVALTASYGNGRYLRFDAKP